MLMTTWMILRSGLLWAMTLTLISRSVCVTELPQMPKDWPQAFHSDTANLNQTPIYCHVRMRFCFLAWNFDTDFND